MQDQSVSVIPFSFDSLPIRTIVIDGEPWFVARDVAEALGYAKPQNAVSAHCKYPKLFNGPESGRLTDSPRGITIIPERDVYRLISRSELPAAEKFEEWVYGEVLPSIRKTGSYGTPAVDLNDPAFLRSTLLTYTEKVIALEDKVVELSPKAGIADRIHTSDGLFGFRQAAKILAINENRFRDWLVRNDWVYYLGKRLTGKHRVIQKGYIVERVKLIQVVGEDDKSIKEMYFTAAGIHRLAEIFNADQLDLKEVA